MQHTRHDAILGYCRSGFEGDLIDELRERAAKLGLGITPRSKPAAGFVEIETQPPGDAERLWRACDWSALTFARQWLHLVGSVADLPPKERAQPLAAALAQHTRHYSELYLEHPDTNTGKSMSRFCRGFRAPLEQALSAAGIAKARQAPRVHVFFEYSSAARLALSSREHSAPWALGIPRLKAPRAMPSRAGLKLEEALTIFVGPNQPHRANTLGTTAVDLGAAPGGWSWVLARAGLRVTAIDRGRLAPCLAADDKVSHQRADGFRYRPAAPVDLLVCDMIEQPQRIAALVSQWLRRGDCRGAIVTLKLPMKRRWATVSAAVDRLQHAAPGADIRCKQLYHNREEVTVAVLPDTATRNNAPK